MRKRFLLPMFVAACGSHSEVPRDGGESEDAGSTCEDGPVRVVVESPYAPGTPLPGIDVIANDGAGAVISRESTDAYGTASFDVPAGSSITVLRREPWDAVFISTVFEVEPCDVLMFGTIEATAEVVPGDEEMFVEVTPYATPAVYGVHNGCTFATFSSELEGTIPAVPACSAGPHDYLAYAIGNEGLLATSLVEDVPFLDGSTVTFPANWLEPVEITATVTGLPGPMDTVIDSVGFSYDAVHEDLVYPFLSGAGVVMPGADVAVTIRAPRFGDAALIRTSIDLFTVGEVVARDRLPAGQDLVLESADLLPFIDSIEFDSETRVLRWTTSGGGRSPDGVYGFVDLTVGTTDYMWLAIGPATDSFTLPLLPADLEPGPPAIAYAHVALYESSDLEGYRAFRATAERDYSRRFNMVGLAERQRLSTW